MGSLATAKDLSMADYQNQLGPVTVTPAPTGTVTPATTQTAVPPGPAPAPSLQDMYTTGLDPALAAPNSVGDMTSAGSAVGAKTNVSGLNSPVTVNSNPSLPGGGTTTINSEGYTAIERELSDKARASVIASDMLAKDSPLMQRAKQEGILYAASRGLQNSSIAAGSAMGSMVDKATPIVLQEAQSLTSMDLANLEEANRAAAFTAAAKNSASLTAAQLKSQEGQTIAGLKSTESIASAQLTSAQKQQAAQILSAEAMFTAQQKNQMAQFNANWKNQASMLNAELTQQNSQFNASQQNAINTQIMTLNASLNEQYLRGTQAMDLATIQGQFQTLITNNAIAGEMFNGYMSNIGTIMANPDMDPGRVAAAIQIQQNMLTQGLTFIGQMSNFDFSGFVPGGTTAPTSAPFGLNPFGQPMTSADADLKFISEAQKQYRAGVASGKDMSWMLKPGALSGPNGPTQLPIDATYTNGQSPPTSTPITQKANLSYLM